VCFSQDYRQILIVIYNDRNDKVTGAFWSAHLLIGQ
jgi:hypothetical protein